MAAINRKIEGEVIGELDDWVLIERDGKSSGEWQSLKLMHMRARKGQVPKRTYFLGWNGDRVSGSKDAEILKRHQPDLYRWVLECLRAVS